jgi:hypothetical protein
MSIKQKYTLGKIKQLIDLNGDSINFDLTFSVRCHDPSVTFQMLVVDQNTLDNNPDIVYKDVTGEISGNINADKNVYQNYFLILKADKVCEVDVTIDKKEIPPAPSLPDFSQSLVSAKKEDKSDRRWIKIVIITVIVLGGIGVLYWLYKRNKSTDINRDTMNFKSPPHTRPSHSVGDMQRYQPTESRYASPYQQSDKNSPSPSFPSPKGSTSSNSLLERLRKFQTTH